MSNVTFDASCCHDFDKIKGGQIKKFFFFFLNIFKKFCQKKIK
jgi:hypothetical protein